jgi:hypothetical protein
LPPQERTAAEAEADAAANKASSVLGFGFFHAGAAPFHGTSHGGGGCLHALVGKWRPLLVPPHRTGMAWPTDALALLEAHAAAAGAAAAGAAAAAAGTSAAAAAVSAEDAASDGAGLLLAASLRVGAHAMDAFLHALLARFAALRSALVAEHGRVLQAHAETAQQRRGERSMSPRRAARFQALAAAAARATSGSSGSSTGGSSVRLTLERSFWSLPASLPCAHGPTAGWGDEGAASAVAADEVRAAVEVLCSWVKDVSRCRKGVRRVFDPDRWPLAVAADAKRGPAAGLRALLRAEGHGRAHPSRSSSSPGVPRSDGGLTALRRRLDDSLDDLAASAAHQAPY